MKRLVNTLLLVLLITLLSGCDRNEPDEILDTYNVRYEAIISNPEFYDMKILFAEGEAANADNMKTETIGNDKWIKEIKNLKYGSYIYMSVTAIAKVEVGAPDTDVTARLFVNDKLIQERTGNFYSAVGGTVVGALVSIY